MQLREALFRMMPFLTLIVVWLGAVFVIRMRQQRELQREIDQLNDIEKTNR
jgi:preprotein translocase subunit YajC